MPLTPTQQTKADTLTKAFGDFMTTFGAAPGPVAVPGSLAVYDGTEADAMAFARRGVNPVTGRPAFGSDADFQKAVALAAALEAAPDAQSASDLIPRAGDLDTDAAEFLVLVGLTQGGDFWQKTFSAFPDGPRLSDAIKRLTTGGQAGIA